MTSRIRRCCGEAMAEAGNAQPLNRPNGREVLECGGWRGTGLTPLWTACGGSKRKRCVPSPLTHRTPKRWRAGRAWRWLQSFSDKPEPINCHDWENQNNLYLVAAQK